MTASLTNALRIATGGMQYSQIALGTISHNIANANTTGYSRQSVAASAVSFDGFGAGVQLEGINRISDQQLQGRLFQQQSDVSYADSKSTYLTALSSIFNPTGTSSGLSDNINAFFGAMSTLAGNPTDSALQRNVVESADLLTQNLQGAAAQLTQTSNQADAQITSDLSSVNQILQRISELNTQIANQHASANGTNANDLMDQRDQQVTALSKYFKVNLNIDSTSGAYRLTTETGRRLVDDSGYVQFERSLGAPGAPQGIGYRSIQVNGGLSPNLILVNTNDLTSGEIKALVDIRDTAVPNLQNQLDELTNTLLLGAVNAQSSRGSSFPPVNSLASGNTSGLAGVGTDLYAGFDSALAGATFNVSVVDASGNVIASTVGNGGPIALPGAGPFSLTDLATLVNGNADVGNTALGGSLGVTATAGVDANGKPQITFAAANGNNRIVLSNASGDVLGSLGMNTFFTGTGASNIAVKSSIETNPSLIPTAQMRASDGGLSSLNADNVTALAQLADSKIGFSTAGGLPAQNVTGAGYADSIASNLAVTTSDAKSNSTFAGTVLNQLSQQMGSVSGVDLNEELSQMLIFQQGFQASAHIITVVDDLLNTLFNSVR
jgi:flagellar hook-associated protein 1 FlgK